LLEKRAFGRYDLELAGGGADGEDAVSKEPETTVKTAAVPLKADAGRAGKIGAQN